MEVMSTWKGCKLVHVEKVSFLILCVSILQDTEGDYQTTHLLDQKVIYYAGNFKLYTVTPPHTHHQTRK